MLTLTNRMDKMRLLGPLLMFFVVASSFKSIRGENHEQNCSYDPMEELLMCTMRTLEPSQETANHSIHKNHHWSQNLHTSAKNLIIRCSTGDDNEYQESVLRKNHFGYLPNLRTLQLVNCKIRTIPALAFSGLSGLVELNVETRNSEWSSMVMEVEKDAFRGLNDLRKLNLTKNNLWTLPPSAFCGLASLTTLNLSTNYLQDVSDLGFASTNQIACRIPLRIVDLSSNSFSKLSHKAFGQLKKLEYLNLEGNNLNVVDDDALGELSTLRTLKLSDNHLVALPPELLKQSEYIQELYLQNNSLSALAPRIFNGLKQLLVLNLSRNEISDDLLSSETFSSLVRLMALDLSHNRIQKIRQNVLTGLTSLQLLDLSFNQLESIHRRTFLNLRNLHTLKLSHNSIDKLHDQSFAGLRVLSSLSLERNRLKKINEEVLANCTSLTTLILSGNSFNQVPRGLRILSKLKTIDLSFNSISILDNSSFIGLNPDLYGISLAGNGIIKFNASVFVHIPKIEVLNLANNNIDKLKQGVFNEVPKLRMLRLDHNQLQDINGILVGLADLQWLNVSSNQLRWFDYAFFPKKLEWLDLHNNQIEDLGNYYKLGEGFALKTLDVRSNQIKRIESLSLIQSIQTVLLNNNHISKIKDRAFNGKPNLLKVDLSNNKIRDLTLSALSVETSNTASIKGQKSKSPEFYLAGNPLSCDCETDWLQKINSMNQNRKYAKIIDIDEVTCKLNNQPGLVSHPVHVKDIQSSDFVCQYQAHCFALCMCCDFFACDCRMQCPEGCSCFHDSTWTSNIIQCSLRGHQDVPPLIPMDATSIRLDGNNFTGILESQAFIGRKRVRSLYLNNSQIAAINNQTFNGLTELLSLHLQDNLMQRLEGYEFGNLTSLKELHLERNQLVYINDKTFSALVSLEVLHLDDNLLSAYPAWTLSQTLPSLNTLKLSGNPWSCECTFVHKLQVFVRKNGVVVDIEQIECSGDGIRPLVKTLYNGENITCSDAMAITSHPPEPFTFDVIPIALASIAVCIIIAVTSIILFVFRTPLKVWLHSKYGVRVLSSDGKSGRDKLYDAFVSYSLKDEDFVTQILIPQLEHQDMASFKLCLQYRDLPKSSSIAEAFPGVSQLCAKHILVVTRAYLESEWSQIKFAVKDFKRWRPVIILLEELSNLDLAAVPEFNLLLKTGPTISWRDPGFWNKVRYYLPDARFTSYKHRNLHGNIMSLNATTSVGGNSGPISSPKHTDITSSVGNYLQHAGDTPNKSNNNQILSSMGGIGSSSNWQYEDSSSSALHLLNSSNSNNSSQASTRSTIAGSSPRTVTNNASSNGSNSSSAKSNQINSHNFNSDMVQVVSNPLDALSESAYRALMQQSPPPPAPTSAETVISNVLTQQQQEHIYHTLDPEDTFRPKQSYGGNYDTLGKLEVMLPNGKMVPATLVRNVTGRIVPLVDMGSPERRMDEYNDVSSNSPLHPQPQLTPQQKYCLDNIGNPAGQRLSPVHSQKQHPQINPRNPSTMLSNIMSKDAVSPLGRNGSNVDFHNTRRQQNSNRQFL